MTDDLNGVYAHGVEEIASELRQEFIDEAKEWVEALVLLLEDVRHERADINDLIPAVQRTALTLRVKGGDVGLRLIGTVAHRLEDYLANVRELPPRAVGDLQAFVDVLDDILEGRVPFNADASQLVRKLPAKIGFSESDIEVRNVEVMLVMLHGAAMHYVQRELQQIGYRVSTVSTVFEAFSQIIQTKPDLVIISAIMPELDGLDLAIGLHAMPATRNIPLALITSLDEGDEHLAALSKGVPIIHKGPSFGDDLFKALDNLFLI